MKKVSECCEAELDPMFLDNERCSECGEHCTIIEHYECDECEDTGEVEEIMFDHEANEWITNGNKVCICKI